MTDKNFIVSSDDIMKYRTPKELQFWIDEIRNEVKKDNEKITAIRLRDGKNIKVLIEEIIPLSQFCNRYFDERIKVKPIIGNQSYDAEVQGYDNIKFIEVTRAINCYYEKLRNEHLDKNGSVSAVGKIDIIGTKASGCQEVIIHQDAVNHKDTMKEIKDLIYACIQKKITKQNNYNEKTLLIVSFDDSFFFEDDKKDIDNFLDKEIKILKHNFTSIAVIGTQNKYYSVLD